MTVTGTLRVGTLALLTASALAACSTRESGSAADTGASRGGMASAPATPAAANTTATAGASTAGAPANIVYLLDQANEGDSVRGRLAESKGTSPDVKSFARLMMGEHHALRAQGQALAKKLGVTPEKPEGDQSQVQAKQEMDGLTAMAKGPAWDRAYIGYEVGYHEQLQQTATKALDAAQNAQLKNLIKQAGPVIQHHLDRARQVQKKLGSGSTT
jgi:putative membrane protein